MRILAVGTRFFPFPHAGDKTFWASALRSLADQGDEVRVLSIDIRSSSPALVTPRLNWESIPAIPFFLGRGPHRDRYNPGEKEIGAITNYVSKSITMPRLFDALRRIQREWEPDVVHLMDNLGPAILPFVRRLRSPAFVSAVTYDPRSSLYDWALRGSLVGFDGVAASSDTFRHRLESIGLPPNKIHTVRWGVDPGVAALPEKRAALKRELGLDPGRPLVLWSGFLQQTTVGDFWTALAAAEKAIREVERLEVLFCFKPQHYRAEYASHAGPRLRVTSDPAIFLRARECADLFLNPVTRHDSILAPPLTWVEVMMRGIPILTTPCGGVEETFGGGVAGQVALGPELGSLLAKTVASSLELEGLQRGARAWALKQYTLGESVEGLRALWHMAS